MKKINVGIMGLGKIAETMALTLTNMDDVVAYGVGSRSLEKAEAFAGKFGFTKAYGSYEGLVSDPEVDLVYISTPHSHHHRNIMLSLEHNKHVLCEKAFTVNASQAKEALTFAESKGLLLAEAIWTRYMPMSAAISRMLSEGVIGEVTGLTANLGYRVKDVPRLSDPSLAGGALLDVGVYTINFASMVLGGEPCSVSSSAVMYHTGVDAQNSITLCYKGGEMAVLHSTMMSNTDRQGIVFGEKGFMVVDNINNPASVKIYNSDRKVVQEHFSPPQITGFEYQVQSCAKAIREGRTECPEMPHKEIVRVMEMMDGLRREWGLSYPDLELPGR